MSNQDQKTTVNDDFPDLIDTYYSNLGKRDHGITYINLTRRRIISAFQWISNIVFFCNGIIALVDVCLSPAGNQYWLYYNQASAAAAGYPSVQSNIGWVPYLILTAVSLGFSLTAAFMELRCYSIYAIGLDLKWSIYTYYSYDEKVVIKSLENAQRSFSPHGNCYDNYFYITPLYHIVIFMLIFLHVFYDFNIISFTPVIIIFSYSLFVILCIYMGKLYFYPLKEIERQKRIKNYQIKYGKKE